jgi:hypothetical protein
MVIFVHAVKRGSRLAKRYEPHPTIDAITAHMIRTLIQLVRTSLSDVISIATVRFE